MEALKKNTFLIAMVVVGIALVICFAVFVVGAWATASSLRAEIQGYTESITLEKEMFKEEARKIQESKGITPVRMDVIITEEWAQLFEEEKKHYSESIKNILKGYQTMDVALEQWFPGTAVRDGKAEPGDFVARYADETPRVEKITTDAKIELGLPKKGGLFDRSDEEPDGYVWDTNLPALKEEMLRDVQKRFWIRAKLGAALIAAKGVRLEKIEFPKIAESEAGSPRLYDLPRLSPTLPPLGKGIPVIFTAQLYYENIAEFIRALLAAKLYPFDQIPREDFIPVLMGVKEPPSGVPAIQLPIRIKKLVVAQTETPPEEKAIPVREEDLPTWKPPEPPKPPVRVTVECVVMDFDISDATIEAISKIEWP